MSKPSKAPSRTRRFADASYLIVALALAACKSTPPVETGEPVDTAPAPGTDSETGGESEPWVPDSAWCDAAVGGPPGVAAPIVALSEAHATVRYFGVEGDATDGYGDADGALHAALAGDGYASEPDLHAYALELDSICDREADARALGAASVVMVGDTAWVRPGTGAVVVPEAASAVVLDLRDLPSSTDLPAALEAAVAQLVAAPWASPDREIRAWDGLLDSYWSDANVYGTSSTVIAGEERSGAASVDRPFAIVTGAAMPAAAAEVAGALRLEGRAWLVGADVWAEVAESDWWPVGDRGLVVRTRTLMRDGAPWPDTIACDVPTADPEAALGDILDWGPPPPVSGSATRARIEVLSTFGERADPDLDRATMRAAPIVAHGAARRFFPYFDTVGDTIDERLVEVLGRVDALEEGDRAGQGEAIGRFGNALSDGHMFVFDDALTSVEDCLLVRWEQTVDGPVAKKSLAPEVSVGDRVVSIDGVPYVDWLALQSEHLGGATPGYREDIALRALLDLPAGDSFTLELMAADGTLRAETPVYGDCTPFYDPSFWALDDRASGPLTDLGHPDLYFINLDGSQLDEVAWQAHLTAATGSAALILDARGYPAISHSGIAGRLQTDAYTTQLYRTPQWTGPDAASWSEEIYPYEPLVTPRWDGPLVVLIGPRSVSAMENLLGMMPERVTYVGRQTAGTNGNITGVHLPGAHVVTFTGMEVRGQDGSVFHGVGVLPDVEAWPTQDDIVAGRDPVLDAAIDLLVGA